MITPTMQRLADAARACDLHMRNWSAGADDVVFAVYGPGDSYFGMVRLEGEEIRQETPWYRMDRGTFEALRRAFTPKAVAS